MADFFQLTVTQWSRTWANTHRLRRSPRGGLGWGARFSPSPPFVQVPRAPYKIEHWPASLGQQIWHRCAFIPVLVTPQFSSVTQLCPNLRPHEPQHARPLCPSPTPRVHPNPCPLSQWCHPTISSSVIPFSSCPQSFPASGSFPNESALHTRWPKYWSFSFNISPSN